MIPITWPKLSEIPNLESEARGDFCPAGGPGREGSGEAARFSVEGRAG